MTAKTKVRILVTVTLVIVVGLIAMLIKGIIIGIVVLVIVWLGHIFLAIKLKRLKSKQLLQ
mgnify:CR=1 FL=1